MQRVIYISKSKKKKTNVKKICRINFAHFKHKNRIENKKKLFDFN